MVTLLSRVFLAVVAFAGMVVLVQESDSVVGVVGTQFLTVGGLYMAAAVALGVAENRLPRGLARPEMLVVDGVPAVFHRRWPWPHRFSEVVGPGMVGLWGVALLVAAVIAGEPGPALIAAPASLALLWAGVSVRRERRTPPGILMTQDGLVDQTIGTRQEFAWSEVEVVAGGGDMVMCVVLPPAPHVVHVPLHWARHEKGRCVIHTQHVGLTTAELVDEINSRAAAARGAPGTPV